MEPELQPEEEEAGGLEIGDSIYILGGRLNKTRGVIYGFRPDRFTVLPTGVADRVITIPLIDGGPDPELGISEIMVLKKAAKPGFTVLLDLRAGQTVETFVSGGAPSTTYTVKEVNEAADSAILADQAGEEEEFLFNFTGIPESYPFEVMRARDAPAEEEATPPGEEAEKPPAPLRVEDGDAVDDVPEDAEPIADVHTFALGAEIELPAEEELQQISTAGRIYPDVFQRSEMLSQLIQTLPEASQRNPLKLQEIRRLVEMMMYLRNEVVVYGMTGEPRGDKPTSLGTLAELITRVDPPLARGVADVKKTIVLSHTIKPESDPVDGGLENDDLIGEYLFDTITRADTLEKVYQDSGEGAAGTPPGAFYTYLESLRKTVGRPYHMSEGGVRTRDIEVFRLEPPGGESEVPSLEPLDPKSDAYPSPALVEIPFSLIRILGGRIISTRIGQRQVETAELPELRSTLLFPRSTLREMGSIRSGSLAIDMSLAMTKRRLIGEVIQDLGEPSEFPTAEGILLIGLNGIAGNVTITDWIESQSVQLFGLGDAQRIFQGYGVSGIEWTMEQSAVLQGKVDSTIAALRIFLARQREENATVTDEPKPAPLLEQVPATTLLALAEGEPLLQKVIETLHGYMGAASEVDVIWFTTLAVAMPDLLLAVLGQQPMSVVRERMRLIQARQTEASENGYRLRMKLENAGEPPQANPCVHVANLEKIRRIKDDADRTKLLAKFLGTYRSRTEDNWVWCNVCDKHLLCAHELLQIQQFIRPKEREALHKEMLLHFSAGVEGRHFLCSVCGQSLTEIEYDTSLEFDDEGRPMSGRSAMVDTDAIAEQEITDLLSGPAGKKVEEELVFATDEASRHYRVFKRIAGLLGIAPVKEDYQRLLDSMASYMATLVSREVYAEDTKGKKAPEYDVYRSLRIVSAAAALMLLDIQTHMPDYTIYFTSSDCRGGFGGWPLVPTEVPTTSPGLACVSLVVAGVNDDEEPWNLTSLQRQPNLLKRRDAFLTFVKGQVDGFMKSPTVQATLARKREDIEKIGARVGTGKTRDQLRGSFRPVPFKVSVAEAAAEPIVAAGASPRKAAEAWIRTAHGLASGGVFKSISRPTDAWSEMPKLDPRAGGGAAGVRAVTAFTANIVKPLDAAADPETYWRLFANLCWKGETKGQPHKLGIGLTCGECGLNFEEAPVLTAAREVVGAEEAARVASKLVRHMETQGVIISEGTFTELLDAAHRADAVSKVVKHDAPIPTFEVFEGYVPLEGWSDMLLRLQVSLAELGTEATSLQIATASEDLVRAIGEKEAFIRERIGVAAFTALETFTTKTPRECGNALMTAFLVPFQRWISGLDSKTFRMLDSYELSKETMDDIVGKGLVNHIKALGEPWQLKGLPRAKAVVFVKELSGYCRNAFPSMREGLTPGGSMMVTYLLRAYVMGAVQRFLDPHIVPAEVVEEAAGEDEGTGLRGLQRSFLQCVSRYSQGSRIPNEEEIRLDLEKRAEAEKQKFIKRLDKMSREQRKVELMNKSLGIGEWAVGGTKAIREYDEDRYEAERTERAQAGLVDYPEVGAEEGYDHVDQAEDDY